MRVALLGYGAVAAVHARGFAQRAELSTVYGPDRAKAQAFALAHAIAHAEIELEAAVARADAAIVCSPSPLHYPQSRQVLAARRHCLVELPSCASVREAQDLHTLACGHGLTLQCAQTSRYLEPYRRLREWIPSGRLGAIQHATYIRSIPPRSRSWTDDALLHHAEHPLDLFLDWFGSLEPLGCAAHPGVPGAQDLSLLALAAVNIPISISISYTARLAEVRMTIVGSQHTVATDGFSYIASDDPALNWKGDEQQVYEQAVAEQDRHFLDACRNGTGGIPWEENIRLTNCVEKFAGLWNRR